jgi:hypothetical protein
MAIYAAESAKTGIFAQYRKILDKNVSKLTEVVSFPLSGNCRAIPRAN